MNNDQTALETEIVAAIRRIIRAIDLHSRQLVRDHRLTGPQLATLREIAGLGPVSVSALARSLNLSQPTVTGILARLERQALIRRERSKGDRRTVLSTITPIGARSLRDAPSLLQDRFRRELGRLEEWEQTQTLATLQRIAAMMDAEALEADPVLTTEVLDTPEEPTAEDAAQSQGSQPGAPKDRGRAS